MTDFILYLKDRFVEIQDEGLIEEPVIVDDIGSTNEYSLLKITLNHTDICNSSRIYAPCESVINKVRASHPKLKVQSKNHSDSKSIIEIKLPLV